MYSNRMMLTSPTLCVVAIPQIHGKLLKMAAKQLFFLFATA